MNSKREKWIDNAKGLAILFVIVGHVSSGLVGIWNFKFVYGIHLVMFFILAGYTTRKKEVSSDFLSNKFNRLMVPYFFTCCAIILTDVINCYIAHDRSIETITRVIGVDLTRSFFASGSITYFGTIDIGTRIGAIWFLPAMFFAVIFFQIILKYFEDRDDISGMLSAGIAALGVITARFIWLPFSIQAGMLATFFLWIGYIIKKQQLLLKLRWYHYAGAQVILLAGIYKGYCNVSFVNAGINDWIISVVVGLSGCLLIYLCAVLDKGKILEYIGKNSLIVLCTHLYALETMGKYIAKLLDKLSLVGNLRVWICIAIEVLFAVVTAFVIERVSSYVKKNSSKFAFMQNQKVDLKRDKTIDVVKGIFIITMLIGHFSINTRLRIIIYSCHMIAFVFLSGYFYKSSRKCVDSLKRMAKSFLIPYIYFVLGVFILDTNKWSLSYFKSGIIKYLLGISFSKNLLTEVGSVGPVYFILLLFVVRIVYMLIDKLAVNEFEKWFATLTISFLGIYLGNRGYWLPWSIDVALYCVIFYKIGLFFRQKGIVEFIKNNYYIYFLTAPIWVYMIYQGGMEIAIRRYGQYGLVVIGSIMGVLTIYIFADYIQKHVGFIGQILNELGQDTIYIIIIHTLLDSRVRKMIALRFDSNYFTHMFISILLELFIAVAVKYIILGIKYKYQIYKKVRQ